MAAIGVGERHAAPQAAGLVSAPVQQRRSGTRRPVREQKLRLARAPAGRSPHQPDARLRSAAAACWRLLQLRRFCGWSCRGRDAGHRSKTVTPGPARRRATDSAGQRTPAPSLCRATTSGGPAAGRTREFAAEANNPVAALPACEPSASGRAVQRRARAATAAADSARLRRPHCREVVTARQRVQRRHDARSARRGGRGGASARRTRRSLDSEAGGRRVTAGAPPQYPARVRSCGRGLARSRRHALAARRT